MLPMSIKLTIKLLSKLITGRFLGLQRRVRNAVRPLCVVRRSARRLDAMGDRMLLLHGKIERMREHIHKEEATGLFDDDGSPRTMLAGLKEEAAYVRCQVAQMQVGVASARLNRAFDRLGQIATRTFAAADELQWEIDDHDRHLPGGQ